MKLYGFFTMAYQWVPVASMPFLYAGNSACFNSCPAFHSCSCTAHGTNLHRGIHFNPAYEPGSRNIISSMTPVPHLHAGLLFLRHLLKTLSAGLSGWAALINPSHCHPAY